MYPGLPARPEIRAFRRASRRAGRRACVAPRSGSSARAPRETGARRAHRRPDEPGARGRDGEQEAADGRAEGEAELPGEGRERHVAAQQSRLGEIGDERRLHRSVDALADPEDAHRHREQDRRAAAVETAADDRDGDPAARPEEPEHREHPHAPVALRQLRDRQLGEHDHDRVDEEDRADRGLRHARLVLREHREQLETGHAGEDEEGVQPHDGHEGPVTEHLAVASRPLVAVARAARVTHPERRRGGPRGRRGTWRRRGGRAGRTCRVRRRLAMSPPMSAPRPMPRFIITRCIANVAWRRSGGESEASSVDCAGQKKPVPIPTTAAARNPCHGTSTSANAGEADRAGSRARWRVAGGRRSDPREGPRLARRRCSRGRWCRRSTRRHRARSPARCAGRGRGTG